jgi:hypothetical protein
MKSKQTVETYVLVDRVLGRQGIGGPHVLFRPLTSCMNLNLVIVKVSSSLNSKFYLWDRRISCILMRNALTISVLYRDKR